MNYTIPRTTPSGKYLLRGEHLYYRSSRFNDTQLYLNCAHIEVLGPGGGMHRVLRLTLYQN